MLLAVDALGLNRPHIHPRKSEISRRLTLIQRFPSSSRVCWILLPAKHGFKILGV